MLVNHTYCVRNRPEAGHRCPVGAVSFLSPQSQGRGLRAMVPCARLRSVVQRGARYRDARDPEGLRDGRAPAGGLARAPAISVVARWPDRSRSQPAIYVRRTDLRGLPGRHAGLGAARERRAHRGPQFQAASPPWSARGRSRGAERHRDRGSGCDGGDQSQGDRSRAVRRSGRAEREHLAERAIRPRRPVVDARVPARSRVLLQDVHVAGMGGLRTARAPLGRVGPRDVG